MSQQFINLGTNPNDGTGDPLRVGGDKINDNFSELYAGVAEAKAFAHPFMTWNELQQLSVDGDMPDGQKASVSRSDTGTHTTIPGDVGASGGVTPNSGEYIKLSTNARPVRLAPLDSSLAESAATLSGLYANANTDADIPGAPAGSRGSRYWNSLTAGLIAYYTTLFSNVPFSATAKAVRDSANRSYATLSTDGTNFSASFSALTINVRRLITAKAVQIGNVVLERRQAQASRRATADANRRMASSVGRDGSLMIPSLRRGNGKLLYSQVDDLITRFKTVEDTQARRKPANIERLNRMYWDAPVTLPTQAAEVTCAYSADGNISSFAAPLQYHKEHPFIRRMGGGTWAQTSGAFPGNVVMTQKNNRYGINVDEVGSTTIIEFVISGGVTQFEVTGNGSTYFYMMIDGKYTGSVINPSPAATAGGYRTHLFTIPSSPLIRRIRLIGPSGLGIGPIRLNAGQGRLLDPRTPRLGYHSMIGYLGDSITEGANASPQAFNCWAAQSAIRLGADDWCNMGVGSSGYLQSVTDRERFRVRWKNILTNKNGGPPDALVIAGGVNDSNVDLAPLATAVYELFNGIRNGVSAGAAGTGTFGPIPATDLAGAPNMPIYVLGPFGGASGWGAQQAKQDTIFNEALKFRHVKCFDLSSWWADPAVYAPWYTSPDPIHPNNAGHDEYARRITNLLLPEFKAA